MKKVIRVNNKNYLIKCSSSGLYGAYDYTIYELMPQSRFLKKRYIASGNTFWWDDDIDVEQKFKEIIESDIALTLVQKKQINNIEKFFENS